MGVAQPIDDKWAVSARALYDLGDDPGLRRSIIGVSYDDECYGATAELQRNLQRDATGYNDTTILMRLRLKNLGEFETTAYNYGSDDADDFELEE